MIAEAEEIELQRFALDHAPLGHIGDRDRRKIRLARNRAEARELGAVELDPVILVGMLVLKGFQKLRRIVRRILRVLFAEMRDALHLIARA